MVLYAADLSELSAPTKKISKKRKLEEKADEVPQEPIQTLDPPVEKKKRVMSDKQKAALKQGQETRRLKKEIENKTRLEHEELSKRLHEAAKKPVRTKKERPAVVAIPEDITPAESVHEEEVVKPKSLKSRSKPKGPPEWFKQYVEGVQTEKAASCGQVSKKQESIIKSEALKVAKKSWESGLTRDRVQNEVDSHSK